MSGSIEHNSYKELQGLIKQINTKSFVKLQGNEQVKIEEFNSKRDNSKGEKQQSRKANDDSRQGIIHAQITKEGSVILKLSLLAAGFVIGAGGKSINDMSMKTASQTTSWTFTQKLRDNEKQSMDLRVIVISGPINSIIQTIHIIQNAVNKYKQLVEQSSPDTRVNTKQYVDGIEFIYKPPPLKAMPWSARTFSNNHTSGKNQPILRTQSSTECVSPRGSVINCGGCNKSDGSNYMLSAATQPPQYCYSFSPPSRAPLAYSTPPHTPRYYPTHVSSPPPMIPYQAPATAAAAVSVIPPMMYQYPSQVYAPPSTPAYYYSYYPTFY